MPRVCFPVGIYHFAVQVTIVLLYLAVLNTFMNQVVIAIHGGAGTISRAGMTQEKEGLYKAALREALDAGYEQLKNGASALDAVQAAVVKLEDSPLFNAGRGSVFTHKGEHEMDAAIMDGKTLRAGAVANVNSVRNPVLLARAVMEHTEHVILSGKGAEEFAEIMKMPFEQPDYFFDQYRYDQLIDAMKSQTVRLDHSEKKFGTVGAVALDSGGGLAAATSTGGMTNKRYGRIGDSPLIGSGTFANGTCAVSCTGHGEYFIRSVVAYDVACLMEYKGMTLEQASNEVVNNKLKKLGGEGGLIAIDRLGNFCLPFNSEGMYRAARSAGVEIINIYG